MYTLVYTTSSLQCTYAHLYLLYNAEQSDKQSAASVFEAARMREAPPPPCAVVADAPLPPPPPRLEAAALQ